MLKFVVNVLLIGLAVFMIDIMSTRFDINHDIYIAGLVSLLLIPVIAPHLDL
jgi:hypothetical protein